MSRHELKRGNLLLEHCSDDDLDLLLPDTHREPLQMQQLLFEAHQPVEQVWFLEGSIASVVVTEPSGQRTEVGVVGREGFTGTMLMLESATSPHECFIQIDGHFGHRIAAEPFIRAVERSRTMRSLLLRYIHTFTIQIARSASSNAHQRMEARLARWLLMCHDRVDGDEIESTHQFIAMMIAAERSSVTVALHVLEGEGLIRSTRGRVLIIDRPGLERMAGESYGLPEAEYRRLIGPFGKGVH